MKFALNNLQQYDAHLLKTLRTKEILMMISRLPTSKQPQQFSPSHNTPSNLEPQQPQSPPPNDEEFDSPPILTNDEKRQRQQDDTRDNKKQKQQENTIALAITEAPLPQPITLSGPAPTPTDPLLETLAILTPQIEPQPHITESITNETTINYPNQDQTTTWTHGFKHHSLTTKNKHLPKTIQQIKTKPNPITGT